MEARVAGRQATQDFRRTRVERLRLQVGRQILPCLGELNAVDFLTRQFQCPVAIIWLELMGAAQGRQCDRPVCRFGGDDAAHARRVRVVGPQGHCLLGRVEGLDRMVRPKLCPRQPQEQRPVARRQLGCCLVLPGQPDLLADVGEPEGVLGEKRRSGGGLQVKAYRKCRRVSISGLEGTRKSRRRLESPRRSVLPNARNYWKL